MSRLDKMRKRIRVEYNDLDTNDKQVWDALVCICHDYGLTFQIFGFRTRPDHTTYTCRLYDPEDYVITLAGGYQCVSDALYCIFFNAIGWLNTKTEPYANTNP